VDGGIDAGTARLAFEAGANVFVAGTSVFGNPGGPATGMRGLAEALNPQLQLIS
jgi:pentose-5-phosphate-3-epimerase